VPATSIKSRSLGLLGAGNMAEALVRGALKTGLVPKDAVIASDISAERRAFFERELGVRATPDNHAVVRRADVLVLCVKPQQVDEVLSGIKAEFDPQRHVLASICAGVTTARLEKHLPVGARTVRVMPNTPMLVGLGAACIAGGAYAQEADLAEIEALFSSAAVVMRVKEPLLDAVTGLSGSGPAYLFYLVEAMTEAGMAEGLTQEDALKLSARTCLGAAKMLEDTGLPPDELRRRVTSPNGTTQAAVEQLDAGGVKAKLTAAVRRAVERSRELGRS